MSSPTYVRPARPSDAPALAELQASRMMALLEKFVGAELSSDTLSTIDVPSFTHQWDATIRSKPQGGFTLVAIGNAHLYGFAAGMMADGDSSAQCVITSFEVDPESPDALGHRARLMAAIADQAKGLGARELYVWIFAGDDTSVRTFSDAGFAPCGELQTFEIDGVELRQHLWWATFDE